MNEIFNSRAENRCTAVLDRSECSYIGCINNGLLRLYGRVLKARQYQQMVVAMDSGSSFFEHGKQGAIQARQGVV